jgi:YidC/Oxa1 family membrane protein insertase
MEEKRLLLAVALSLLVLTAYQLLFAPPPKPHPSPTPVASAAAPSPGPSAAPLPGARPGVPSPAPTPAGVAAPVSDEKERRVEVQNTDVAVAFSNRGARLLSWRLLHFADPRGRPEEMVQAVVGGPRPLDLETGDPAVDASLKDALFKPSAESLSLSGTPGDLSFRYAGGDVEAEKALHFEPRGYLVSVRASVRKAGRDLPVRVFWGPGIGNPTPAEMEVQGYHAPQAVYLGLGGVERIPAPKIGPAQTASPVRWAGVEGTHFAALWLPPPPGAAELRGVSLPPGEDGKPRVGVQAGVPLPGEAAMLYVGPKDYLTLSKLDHDLQRVVPVGDWIGPIVVALMALLRWVHGHVGNYGWSIVLLTVMINLVMAPLRHYSIANGLKMAKLAPEMKVIQDRYRKVPALDPRRQEMQKEVAALYGRHGMSMSTQMTVGCLPILLTMPFLIAFYRVLSVSIELRGASFLWIPDLSQKDPYFVTPLLMGLSMFAMQRMTPTTMDPAQQRIMMIMPLMFVGMFLWAPAGLNLYWLASNVCSIIQQAVTLRILKSREDKTREERRRK